MVLFVSAFFRFWSLKVAAYYLTLTFLDNFYKIRFRRNHLKSI
jgi:hypothetical protein